MSDFCVVLVGSAGQERTDWDFWAPVASAFKLSAAEFEQRVLKSMPLVVKRALNEPAAAHMAQRLRSRGVDARVHPDDPQQVYFKRGGVTRGPLPYCVLDLFIYEGERYLLRGDAEWQVWSHPATIDDEFFFPPSSIMSEPDNGEGPPPLPSEGSAEPPPLPAVDELPPPLPRQASAAPPIVSEEPLPPPKDVAGSAGLSAQRPALASPVNLPAGNPREAPAQRASRARVVWGAVALAAVAIASAGYFVFSRDKVSAAPQGVAVHSGETAHPGTKSDASGGASLSRPVATATSMAAPVPKSAPTTRPIQRIERKHEPLGSTAESCSADAPQPQLAEERALLANERRFLTGRNDYARDERGDTRAIEAALGYDGQCRPSPFQIYIFRDGSQIGTASSSAMLARTDGSITSFKLLDARHVQIEVARYTAQDPLCCASSHEQRVLELKQRSDGSWYIASPGNTLGETLAATSAGPSFDCNKAVTTVEVAICGSRILTEMDAAMARAYRRLLEERSENEGVALRSSQRQWIRDRQARCSGDETCIISMFNARIAELQPNISD